MPGVYLCLVIISNSNKIKVPPPFCLINTSIVILISLVVLVVNVIVIDVRIKFEPDIFIFTED